LIFDAVFDMKEIPISSLSLPIILTKQTGARWGSPSYITVETHVRTFCLSHSGFSNVFFTSSGIATKVKPHIVIVFHDIKTFSTPLIKARM